MLEKQGDKVRLGDRFIDVITEVEGTATAQCRNLTGNDTVFLEGRDGDGKACGGWVDITRLEWQASAPCPDLADAKASEGDSE